MKKIWHPNGMPEQLLIFFEKDVRNFFEKGIMNDFVSINRFRAIVYDIGTSLELLLVDCLLAIFTIKCIILL